MQQILSASDLLSIPEWHGEDGQQLGGASLRQSGAGLDALEGLHNNLLALAQQRCQQLPSHPHQHDHAAEQQQQLDDGSPDSHINVAASYDLDLLAVDELPHNPPEPHPPVIPHPAQLTSADVAGFLYAEPSYYQGLPPPGVPRVLATASSGSGPHGEHPLGHLHQHTHLPHYAHPQYHHPGLHPPSMLPHHAPLHHPGLSAAYHQPLLGNPAIVLTRPGLAALHPQPHSQHQNQHAAAPAAAGTTDSAGPFNSAGRPGGGEAPGSPSFLQAALALLSSKAGTGGASAADAGSGAAHSSGNKSGNRSSSSADNPTCINPTALTGGHTPRSAAGAAGGLSPFALAGLAASMAQQGLAARGAPPRPRRQSAQQAASMLNRAVQGGCSDGGSVPDEEDEEGLEYSDDQGPSPREGAGAGGDKGAGGKSKKGGSTRPRSNAAYDSMVDPNLPPDEARRVRRMLSNRESARRSRRRRQTHLSALESQVEALRGEKERLEGELSSTAQQMRAVVAEKQRLQLEVEALRRKMAQMAPSGGDAGGSHGMALPPHPPTQHGSVLFAPQQHSLPAQQAHQVDELQAEWGRFGVALGGAPGVPRASLDGGRKIGRPPSLQRIQSMEQMTKKAKDSSPPHNSQSPPTVLEGLSNELLKGGSTFGALC